MDHRETEQWSRHFTIAGEAEGPRHGKEREIWDSLDGLDGSEDDVVYEANDDCNNELDDSFARELFQSDSESEFEGFDR